MRVQRIRWKPHASRATRSLCYLWLEMVECRSVIPFRANGDGAYSYARAPVWIVL